MICVSFNTRGAELSFEIKGHSGYAESGSDIICATVSSAAYLTANTLTDVFGLKAEAKVDDGYMFFSTAKVEIAAGLFEGLRQHLLQLQQQYPKFIKITTEE